MSQVYALTSDTTSSFLPNDATIQPNLPNAPVEPLLNLGAASEWSGKWLRAVARRQHDIRDVAPHSHAQGQLLGSLEGVLSVIIPTGRWIVPPSNAIWVPPHTSHSMRSYGPFAGWSVYVDETACSSLPPVTKTLRVEPLLSELVLRAQGWNDEPWNIKRERVSDVILDEIADASAVPLCLAEPSDPHAKRVAEAILHNLADHRSVEDWARWSGTTQRTLARRFRAETGLGLAAWRQRARALRATEMLAEEVSVTVVAFDLGYGNVGAFIAMFRRATGTTPGQYRQELKAGYKPL